MTSFLSWNVNGLGIKCISKNGRISIDKAKKEFLSQLSKQYEFLILTETKHNSDDFMFNLRINKFKCVASSSLQRPEIANPPLRGGGGGVIILSSLENKFTSKILIAGHAIATYYKKTNGRLELIIAIYGESRGDGIALRMFRELQNKIEDMLMELSLKGFNEFNININIIGDINLDFIKNSKPNSIRQFNEMCRILNVRNVNPDNEECTFHGYGERNVSSVVDHMFSSTGGWNTEMIPSITDHVAMIYSRKQNILNGPFKNRSVKEHILLREECLIEIQDFIVQRLLNGSQEYKDMNISYEQTEHLSYLPEKLENELNFNEIDSFEILNEIILGSKEIYDKHDRRFYRYKNKEKTYL
jgi:hypothetical protein